jgi:hypothetical protein
MRSEFGARLTIPFGVMRSALGVKTQELILAFRVMRLAQELILWFEAVSLGFEQELNSPNTERRTKLLGLLLRAPNEFTVLYDFRAAASR